MRAFFEKVFGNENIKVRIGRAISENTLPHALMITGDDGSGKLLMAKEIAAAVNCSNSKSTAHPLPCGVCNNCRRIRAEQFLDVHIFRKNEDKASIGVEEIRIFLKDVMMFGAESDYRFYIFENCELMTDQAQNSLLKVLEEPPYGVYIILLCETPDRILTTIKSRVQTLPMSRLSEDELDQFLIKSSDDASLLKRNDKEGYISVLAKSSGSIGQALSMMNKSSLDTAKRSDAYTRELILSFAPTAPYTALRDALRSLPKKKQELLYEIERILDGVSELISFAYDKSKERNLFKDDTEAASTLRQIGTKRLLKIYALMTEIIDSIQKNANISLLITKMTAELCRE